MSEWKEYKLRELTIDGKGHYGIAAPAVEYDSSKYTYLRITDINDDGTLNKCGLKSVSDAKAKDFLLRPNDIVFARTGASVGRSYFYDGKDGELVYAGFLIMFRLDPEKVCPYIIKAYTHSQEYYDWIRAVDNGATRGNINAQTFASMPIVLPPLDEQKRISGVLSSLDDKIDLLHRENATLEALAETLFRHYFIENPNPDWKESPLSTIATFLNGLACQKYPPKDLINRLPVLKIKELSSGITKDSDWATTDVGEEYIVHCGDVIFAWSASLMVKMWNGEDCVLNQHLFKVTSDIFPRWYYYLWCKYHLQEFISIAQSHATTMGHIKRGDLDSAMVLVPSRNEMESFTKQIEPLLKRVETNYSQINNLSFYRDNLLPRLMSGEVKIIEQ